MHALGMRRIFPGSVIGTLLRSRGFCIFVTVAASAQIVLVRLGLPSWPCPWLKATGCPCAGCGLSRSVAATVTGRLGESLHYHLFGPVAAALILMFIIAALMRESTRLRLAASIESVEVRTGISGLLACALLAYWLFRLIFLGGPYVRLMNG